MSRHGPPPTLEEFDAVSGGLARKLAAFMQTLRGNGFALGLREGQDAAALLAAGYGDEPSRLRCAFKHLFSTRVADWAKFDGLFDAFWLGRRVRSRSTISDAPRPASSPSLKRLQDNAAAADGAPASDQLRGSVDASDTAAGEGRAEGASRAENLAEVDFRRLTDPADVEQAHAVAARLARVMRTRLTRRDIARRRGRGIHFRRTIHRNVSHGGVAISLVRRRRRRKPLRLVVLLDASGSMSLYTGVFLRFIHGVLDEFREAEAFLFHTRLAHVSDAMKEKDPARALDRLSMMAQGVGGGTKIGESLHTFNRRHAARVIHSRTCVMILSDGYDTGEPALLKGEMAALARRCRRIVWLNPMIGWEGYAPEARGLRAALPYVDLYAPAHTLQSLAGLEGYLARL